MLGTAACLTLLGTLRSDYRLYGLLLGVSRLGMGSILRLPDRLRLTVMRCLECRQCSLIVHQFRVRAIHSVFSVGGGLGVRFGAVFFEKSSRLLCRRRPRRRGEAVALAVGYAIY